MQAKAPISIPVHQPFALVPKFGTSLSLPNQVGYLRAAEIILLGYPLDASQARSMGLVTKVLPDTEVFATGVDGERNSFQCHWFDYWLNRKIDRNPEKHDQYTQWEVTLRNRIIIEYALRDTAKPMRVAANVFAATLPAKLQ